MDKKTLSKYICKLFLLLHPFVLFLVLPTKAYPQEKDFPLTESYISFQTSKSSGDKFYRIMVDEEESPYLNLRSVIDKTLSLKGVYDFSQKKCSVNIFVKGGHFSIDGEKKEYIKIVKGERIPKSFADNLLILHEKELWIHYDLLRKWLPIRITWELDRYYMRFSPQFPLKKEIIQQRERTRETDRQNLLSKEKIDKVKAVEPEGNFNTELRTKLSHTFDDDVDDDKVISSAYLAYDLNSDIYKGTFKINGIYNKTSGESDDSHIRWKYKREEQRYFHLFEAGNIYNTSTLLNPTTILKNGFHIKKLPKIEGKSGFDFTGITEPGTEIDVYINGFIAESIVTKDGSYNLEDQKVSGGDIVILRFYFSDGSSKTEVFQISSDAGKLIPEGTFDYQVFSGQEDDNDKEKHFSLANIRYGLLDNLSVGVHSYHYPELTVSGLDSAWKPYPGLFITTEHMFSEGTMGNAVAIEGNYPPNNFRLETKRIDEGSPLINLQTSEKEYPEYSFVRYSRNGDGWYLKFQYTDTTNPRDSSGYTKYESSIKKKITRIVSVSSDYSLKAYKDGTTDDLITNIIGTEVMYKKHNIRFRWNIDSSQNISYRYQPGRDAKYYWAASVSHNELENNSEWEAHLSFTYKFNDSFSSQVSVDDSNRKVKNSLEDIITHGIGPDKPDQFAMGTILGTVQTSGNDKDPSRPIEGVTVMVGSKRATTDKDGHYKINGLPVNQRVVFKILPGTMEVGLTPKEEFSVFKFRPGTFIEHNPIIQKTVGIDGVVLSADEIPDGAEIHAYHTTTKKKIAVAEINPDGFFVLEGIIPGFYTFIIKGVRDNDTNFAYFVKGDTDWVSELKIDLKE